MAKEHTASAWQAWPLSHGGWWWRMRTGRKVALEWPVEDGEEGLGK